MNTISIIDFKLNKLLKKILKYDFTKQISKKNRLFRGADIQVADDILSVDKKGNFYGDDTYIITKYSKEVSWLIYQIRDIFNSGKLLNYINKYHFYGELAEAANSYIDHNKNQENCKNLLLSIFFKAADIKQKLKHARTRS